METDGLIGNGSVGVVFLDVYDTKMGKGCRLSGVQVVDHVEFEGGGGSGPSIKPRNYTTQSSAAPTPKAAPASKESPGEVPF